MMIITGMSKSVKGSGRGGWEKKNNQGRAWEGRKRRRGRSGPECGRTEKAGKRSDNKQVKRREII